MRKEQKNMERPIIGITMGDPAGNGPELSIKSLNSETLYQKCRPLIIGDAGCLRVAIDTLKLSNQIKVNGVSDPSEAKFEYGTIDVIDMKNVDLATREFGKVQKMCGEAAFQYVTKVIELAKTGEIDATVTNALNKESINLAGHNYSGHTEIYADYTDTADYAMMLAHDELRVVHVSTHVSLLQACQAVKKERVLEAIRLAASGCQALGIEEPKIAVAGLNPHAGENGMFGREEIEEILPAIEIATKEGICIPDGKAVPPDTVFSKMEGGWYDVAVVMYHDQGHIPLKVKGFVYNKELSKWDSVAGVNITLGLPIIRVSVDHGTGFGHAGDGSASPASLNNAIDYAIRFATHKR
ncbi:4-hydroxythreonine-4-phosphate dehydrogenase [Lachnospiraceae bacterium PF1-21]